MRSILKILISSAFLILFIGTVNADSLVTDLNLDCASPVGYNTAFDCTLTGKIKDAKKISSLDVTDITNSRMFKTTNLVKYDISRMSGTLRLATYTGKTFTTSGKATVALRIAYNDIYFKYVTYRLRISDNNTYLSSITIDNSKLNGFNKNTTSYLVETEKDNVFLGATAQSKRADVKGTGSKKLSCGNNNSKLEVVAESGDKRAYNVNIYKKCDQSSKVALKGVKLSTGKMTPEFDPKVTEYKVVVDQNTDKISITGEASSDVTVTGNLKDKEINPGSNKFTISVKSGSDVKKDYIFNVIRQKDDAYLSSLSLSSGALNFDRKTFLYETTVVYDTKNVDVRAVPESENAKVEVTGGKDLKVGENMIDIKVTSETESTNTYKIKLVRLKEDQTIGDNPYIKDIKIKNYNLNFDPNIVNYSLKIKDESKLDIKVELDDPNSKYEIIGNKNLKDGSIITIKSTSSGGFVKLYKIKISKKSKMVYYVLGTIVGLSIIGVIITLFILSKNQKGPKIPIISTNLLSSSKNIVKGKKIDIDENMEKDLISDIDKNNNSKNMVSCPKCGFVVPKSISSCPKCRFKLK